MSLYDLTPRRVPSSLQENHPYVEVDPCLAKGRFLGWDRYSSSDWVCERKEDGERRVTQCINLTAFFSGRRRSVNGDLLEKGANLFHLCEVPPELNGAIFDGEVYIPGGHSNDITSIMALADPAEAKAKILDLPPEQWPRYAIFDVIALPGRKYVTKRSLRERHQLMLGLSPLIEQWGQMRVHFVSSYPAFNASYENAYNQTVALGGEGVVLKDLRSNYVYGPCGSWVKVVHTATETVTCIGIQQGNEGKYANTLGAVVFRGTIKGRAVSGTCSGMSDKDRHAIWADPRKYINAKFDVEFKRITSEGRLISPRIIRWRWDL